MHCVIRRSTISELVAASFAVATSIFPMKFKPSIAAKADVVADVGSNIGTFTVKPISLFAVTRYDVSLSN